VSRSEGVAVSRSEGVAVGIEALGAAEEEIESRPMVGT